LWLTVPVILGLLSLPPRRSFRAPAAMTLLLAFMTQLIYPTLYDGLLALHTVPLVLLTLRNLLLFVLLAWSIAAMWGAIRAFDRTGNARSRDRLEEGRPEDDRLEPHRRDEQGLGKHGG
jgi:hypothetical protein